jgi:hypothetical protein
MNPTPYFLNPARELPPQVYAAPRFNGYLTGRLSLPNDAHPGFRQCLAKFAQLYPVVRKHWACGGYQFDGGFEITTIWSPCPELRDVFLVLGPGDSRVTYWPLGRQYAQSRDDTLLTGLTPIPFSILG